MCLHRGSRIIHVIAGDEVAIQCPVLADFGTLPAIIARRKETLLKHAGVVQVADRGLNKG